MDTQQSFKGETTDDSKFFDQIGSSSSPPYEVVLEINGKNVKMEIDTKAAVSFISSKTQRALFLAANTGKASLKLLSVTSEPVPLLGQMGMQVKYGEHVGNHTLYVVGGSASCLLGRDWLQDIRLNWSNIRTLSAHNSLLTLYQPNQKHAEVFQQELGTIRGFKAQLHLKDGAKKQFRRPCSVPLPLRRQLTKKLIA